MPDLPEQLTVEIPDQPGSRGLMPVTAFENWGRATGYVEVDTTADEVTPEDHSVPVGWVDEDPNGNHTPTAPLDDPVEIDLSTTTDAGATGTQTEV